MNETTNRNADEPTLTAEELNAAIEKEREWLDANNAVSAVTGGPVEDMEGVPLPGDLFQGTPSLEDH